MSLDKWEPSKEQLMAAWKQQRDSIPPAVVTVNAVFAIMSMPNGIRDEATTISWFKEARCWEEVCSGLRRACCIEIDKLQAEIENRCPELPSIK